LMVGELGLKVSLSLKKNHKICGVCNLM
jgi:hypothetical protein